MSILDDLRRFLLTFEMTDDSNQISNHSIYDSVRSTLEAFFSATEKLEFEEHIERVNGYYRFRKGYNAELSHKAILLSYAQRFFKEEIGVDDDIVLITGLKDRHDEGNPYVYRS